VLESYLRTATVSARALDGLGGNRLFIGGKSMGGRMASYLATDASFVTAVDLRGLLCLGYPLHPPGKPEQLRSSHLPDLRVPTLIVQGTRDPFGSPEDIAPHLRGAGVPVTVHAVQGGDHSFGVRKKDGGDPVRTMADVEDMVARWIASR
jgi:predicted alpha/beta-hydrolase family hydrolase